MAEVSSRPDTNEASMKRNGKVWCGPDACELQKSISRWKSLGHYVLHMTGNDHANATLVTDIASGRSYTGLELRDKVLAVACALIDKHNFKPNTMVCIVAGNSDHLLILALAILVAGGTVCCPSNRDPYPELIYVARKVEPKMLFIRSKDIDWSRQLSADLGYDVLGISMDHDGPGHCFGELLNYDYKTQSKSLDKLPANNPKPLDKRVAFIVMSSGTTGRPKAVSVTHLNVLAEMLLGIYSPAPPNDKKEFSLACSSSLDYASGRLIMLGSIRFGYNVVIMDGFDPKTYLEAIQKYRIANVFVGAAFFYNLITYEHLDQYDISSVRFIFPFGAKVAYLDSLRKFFVKHPNIDQVRQSYGASEIGSVCKNIMTPDEYLENCKHCGILWPGVQVKIIDPTTGQLMGPNEIGMVHVKSNTVFPGYYDMELARKRRAATQHAANTNEPYSPSDDDLDPFVRDENVFDSEGYYITGDLAYFNDQAQLCLVGRQKEVMNCRCKKVLPQELEEVIKQHEAIETVCVFGVPKQNEPSVACPRAFVVPKNSFYSILQESMAPRSIKQKLDVDQNEEMLHHVGEHKLCKIDVGQRRNLAEDLMEFVNERVGWKKQLRGGIVVLDQMPTTRTGKIDKPYLRSLDTDQIELYGDRSKE